MNTCHLQEFLLFAKELNYSSAAKKLFITRPTLTDHLNELESELGCKLISKGQGRPALTPAGARFVQTANKLVKEWEDVCEEYQGMAENLLVVTIAATNLPWLETLLYKARRSIAGKYPSKRIDIVTDAGALSTLDALESHANDIVVTGCKSYLSKGDGSPLLEGVCGFKIRTETINLLMTQGNPLFEADSLKAEDLDGATLVLPPDIYQGYLRDGVIERFASRGARITLRTFEFKDHFEYFTYDFGEAFGVVPTTLIPRFGINEREECRTFLLEDLVLSTDFIAAFRKEFVETENGRLLYEEMKKLAEEDGD